MNFDFPCKFLKLEDGTQAITFRNLPEVMARLSADETPDEQAKQAIEDCLASRMKRNEAIPRASEPEAGETVVRLSASQEAKILLHNEMVRLGVSRSELARRTGMRLPDVTRLLNLAHPTKLDAVIHVLNVLGIDIQMSVVPLAQPVEQSRQA